MPNIDKQSIHWIMTILIGLTLGAYGWIFMSIVDTIDIVNIRIDKVENKVDQLNPIFTQIQVDISGIRTNQEWIMKKLQ